MRLELYLDSEHRGRHKDCAECDEIRAAEEHHGQHWECSPCFAIKLGSVQFGGYQPQTQKWRERDRAFDKDNEAYRRLRKQGLQPRGVDKSSLLETMADHKIQVELGRPVSKEQIKAYNSDIGPI